MPNLPSYSEMTQCLEENGTLYSLNWVDTPVASSWGVQDQVLTIRIQYPMSEDTEAGKEHRIASRAFAKAGYASGRLKEICFFLHEGQPDYSFAVVLEALEGLRSYADTFPALGVRLNWRAAIASLKLDRGYVPGWLVQAVVNETGRLF